MGAQHGLQRKKTKKETLTKVFIRLWRIFREVRKEQQTYNISQKSLDEGKDAITKTRGVIYAIAHIHLECSIGSKIYVLV